MEVVEEGIAKNEEARRTSIEERPPPPSMIFTRQLEIQQSHRDERCDRDEHDKSNIQYSEESVYFVAPDTREDVVQLDVDGTERQKSSHEELGDGVSIPLRDLRNLSSDFVGPAGGTIVVREVAPHNGTRDNEGEVNEE